MLILPDRRLTPRFVTFAALGVCTVVVSACQSEPAAKMGEPPQVITGATVLAGDELVPLTGGVVVIEDGVITAVGPKDEVQIPEGAHTIEAHGKTLIPGFIDAHVHIGFYDPAVVLAGGVTTVRDLAWPPERIARLVDASRGDPLAGPTILAAGPMLTAPGGYPMRAGWAPPGTGLEVDRPEDATAAVASVADAGFSIVKIALNPPVGPVLTLDTLSAIVDAAHARDLKVTGHIYGLKQLDKALEAGVDELAHMLMSDEKIPQRTIERMVSAGMTIVPTLSVFSGGPLRTAIANLHAFRKANGRVVYGTDLGNEGPGPGIDAREVNAMHRAGMSSLEIIRSATIDSAAWLGLEGVGSIAASNDADLVLVDGDPLNDPSALTRIAGVWRRGVKAR